MDYRKHGRDGVEMEVPEEVRNVVRPKNTVVEARVNKDGIPSYIVRERNGSVYSNGRSRPRNGAVIGYIIDLKFVERLPIGPIEPKERSMITWAVERLVLDLTKDIEMDLRTTYGKKIGHMAYCMAILRVRNPKLKNSRMKRDYSESVLSFTYTNMPMSKNSVSDYLNVIGYAGQRMKQFLRTRCSRLPPGAMVAVDGSLVTDNSIVNNLSAVSRKTRARGGKDISLIYAYDIERGEPVCFSVYPGNMLDSKAFSDFIKVNNLMNALVIGDKAFSKNAASKEFEERPDLHYLHPVRRNAKVIKKLNLRDYNCVLKTEPGISYCVVHDTGEGIHYYAFRDAKRAAEEEEAYLEDKRKKGKSIDPGEVKRLRDIWGTIVYQSDLDMRPEEVYKAYSLRWTIELMFRLYKEIEEFDDTEVQSDSSVIGEHFINFLSTIMTSRLMNRFLDIGLLDKMTFGEVMDILRRGLKFKDDNDDWVFRAQTDKEKETLIALGLMSMQSPKRGPGRPRKTP